jgi:hypothetical protein
MYNTDPLDTPQSQRGSKEHVMSTPSSKVRRAFFGAWIAIAAVLLVAGRAGGTVGAVATPGLTPVAAEALLPEAVSRAGQLGASVVD